MKVNSNKKELTTSQRQGEKRTAFQKKKKLFHLLASFQAPVILRCPAHSGLILCSLVSDESMCMCVLNFFPILTSVRKYMSTECHFSSGRCKYKNNLLLKNQTTSCYMRLFTQIKAQTHFSNNGQFNPVLEK